MALQIGEEAGGSAENALREEAQAAGPRSLGYLPAYDLTYASGEEGRYVFFRRLLSKCSGAPSDHLCPASLAVPL